MTADEHVCVYSRTATGTLSVGARREPSQQSRAPAHLAATPATPASRRRTPTRGKPEPRRRPSRPARLPPQRRMAKPRAATPYQPLSPQPEHGWRRRDRVCTMSGVIGCLSSRLRVCGAVARPGEGVGWALAEYIGFGSVVSLEVGPLRRNPFEVSHRADLFLYGVLVVTASLSIAELSELFSELGDDLVPEDDPNMVLSRLTSLATRCVPGAEYAGVTIGGEGRRFVTVAATDDVVTRTDEIQYELASGPCVDALIENSTYNAGDLRTDPRWPEFGRRAVELTGVVSMLSFRLYHESHRDLISGLNMYSHLPNAFDAVSETIGLLLATHGAAAAARAEAEQRASNLEIALKTCREIGVAMGILMNAAKITRDQAFDLLPIASPHPHRKLADIAVEVADTGRLPKPPRRRA